MWDAETYDSATIDRELAWAREINPSQPITSGMWSWDEGFKVINHFLTENSDIISFHHYGPAVDLDSLITRLKVHNRPLLCTEYMARSRNSRFQSHLPLFKKDKVGAINWGFVSGKTNTIYPWGSPEGAPEPNPWFHDVLRKDGTPFDSLEVRFIKEITVE